MSGIDAQTFREAAERIASWRHPLLIAHEKPDGDALGSLIAMRAMLRTRGVAGRALLFDPIPDRYVLFGALEPMPVLRRDVTEGDLAMHDAVIILDTCTYTQLPMLSNWLRATSVPKLVVDHHVTRDPIADWYLIDEPAAATCLILYDGARALGWSIDREAADAMFVGIAMDTGWFRHSNTDARALAAAADLVSRGVEPHALFEAMFQQESPARVALLGAALGTLELSNDGRLALMTLSAAAMRVVGASPADTEDIVNEPLRIASVIVSVLLVEQGDGLIRAGFRSKPPATLRSTKASAADIDVATIASALGGGGHRRAAGARIPGRLDDVAREIRLRLQPLLAPSI